jgi:hypothetical protein
MLVKTDNGQVHTLTKGEFCLHHQLRLASALRSPSARRRSVSSAPLALPVTAPAGSPTQLDSPREALPSVGHDDDSPSPKSHGKNEVRTSHGKNEDETSHSKTDVSQVEPEVPTSKE